MNGPPAEILIAAWHSPKSMATLCNDLALSPKQLRRFWGFICKDGGLPARKREVAPSPYRSQRNVREILPIADMFVLHTRYKGKEDALLDKLREHHVPPG